MKLKDLPVGTVVEFTNAVDAFGGYAEAGIRARVKEVEQRDAETLFVAFDYQEFVAHNVTAESAVYGSEKSGFKTATETGVVPDSEGFFFDLEQPASEFVRVVEPEVSPRLPKP